MGGMPMQFVKSTAVYVSCVAGAVSFNESAATPHMTKGSPALLLLTHDTIMRSRKYRNTKGWRPLSRRKRSPPLLLGHEGDAVTGHHCAAR